MLAPACETSLRASATACLSGLRMMISLTEIQWHGKSCSGLVSYFHLLAVVKVSICVFFP